MWPIRRAAAAAAAAKDMVVDVGIVVGKADESGFMRSEGVVQWWYVRNEWLSCVMIEFNHV